MVQFEMAPQQKKLNKASLPASHKENSATKKTEGTTGGLVKRTYIQKPSRTRVAPLRKLTARAASVSLTNDVRRQAAVAQMAAPPGPAQESAGLSSPGPSRQLASSIKSGVGLGQRNEKDASTQSQEVVVQAMPAYGRNPKPPYPELARKRGWQGTVVLAVQVNVSGDVAQTEVKKSSGYELLDDIARKTVRRWNFVPGSIGGIVHDMDVLVPVHFQLQ